MEQSTLYMCLMHLPLDLPTKNHMGSYDYVSMLNTHVVRGHFNKKMSMAIQVLWNFVMLSSKLSCMYCYKFLHVAWQLCCHDIC